MENSSPKALSEQLSQKFLEIFPVNGIYLISLNVTSRKLILLTIMKKGGVLLDDCKYVSSLVSQYIPGEYDLQVQSPGIGYEIKSEKFGFLSLFIDLPVKAFYKDNSSNIKEIEGTLTFVDKVICIKKFDTEKKKMSKKGKQNMNENIISLPLESIIKIKTTFYPEEI